MIQTGDMQAVQAHIVRLGKEIKSMVKAAFEVSYYSRGAWSYEHVLRMSPAERDLAIEFINERLELASKSAFPVY